MKTGEERVGRYLYRWSEGCFPLGSTSLARGAFATVKNGARVCDLGCGAGLLLLLAAQRAEGLELTGVELNPVAAELAAENLDRNGLTGTILTGDLRDRVLLPQSRNLILSNPPWYPTEQKGSAAAVESATVAELCAAAAYALPTGGRFALAHQPTRLVDILSALRTAHLEPKRLKFCFHSPEKPPYAVLVEAVKGGRPGLDVET